MSTLRSLMLVRDLAEERYRLETENRRLRNVIGEKDVLLEVAYQEITRSRQG